VAASAVASAAASVAEPTEPVAQADVPTSQAIPAPVPAAPVAALADSGEEIPVYATSFAPSQRLSYHLRRGWLSGTGVLTWQHDAPHAAGARYELQLDARVAGLSLLSQRSEGGFDAAGLAPQRFTDQRLRGSTRATNFQRERGVIGFSGPSVEYPLIPGVQDRLSWMLQLPAVVDAAPQRAAAGERITLYVIGARGDAAVWVFRFVAAESVTTDAGDVPALKFIREPRQPHDTQAEVWLDPAQHHLPVRARLGNPPDGDVLDMVRMVP
jgi:hypothetical protein